MFEGLIYDYSSWNSVAASVISTVKAQVTAHPGYQIVSTGHSLGGDYFLSRYARPNVELGALSSLAGISLEQNFPGNTVRMYTYGPQLFDAPRHSSFEIHFRTATHIQPNWSHFHQCAIWFPRLPW